MRKLCILMTVGTLAAVVPASARAALFFLFNTTHATPGTRISVRTGGEGALRLVASDSTGIRVFLAPADEIDTITSPDDGRLFPLGRLHVDENGNGSLHFTVPDVPPGDYLTLTYCVRCAPYSGGRELLPTGPFSAGFKVLASEGNGGSPWAPVAIGAVGVGILLVFGGVALAVRRRPSAGAIRH